MRTVVVKELGIEIEATPLRLSDFALQLLEIGEMVYDDRFMYKADGVLYWRAAAIPSSPLWEFGNVTIRST